MDESLSRVSFTDEISTVLQNPKDKFSKKGKKECFHSRKVFALLDLNEKSKDLENLERHVYTCESCQEKFSNVRDIIQFIDNNIPYIKASDEVKEEFDREVNDILKSARYHKNKKAYNKFRRMFTFTNQIRKDLFSQIFVPQMIVVYLCAILIGVGIKFIY